jgi:hypothetical protein
MKLVFVKGADEIDVDKFIEKHHDLISRERRVQIARMLIDKARQRGAAGMHNLGDYLDRLEENLLWSFLSPNDEPIADEELGERLLGFVLSDGRSVAPKLLT